MSQLRQDPVSGEWIILAPGRAARPRFLDEKKKPRKPAPKRTCPFEDMKRSGNWPPILAYPDAAHWKFVLIPNKYPALAHSASCALPMKRGMYRVMEGAGTHDLLVTRDHNKNFAELDPKIAEQLFFMLQERHRMMAKDPCAAYVSSFFNWGPQAGASIWHPHYQTLTMPIVPPHTARSVSCAEAYFNRHHRCVRCDMIKAEKKEKVRIVSENDHAIAIVPFASKQPFEVSILPKRHLSHFGSTPASVAGSVARLLQGAMKSMKKELNDPDLNFFIHGAPLSGHGAKRKALSAVQKAHHWHIEVVPKISIPAGFEISTGIYINVVDPDAAAKMLRI